MKRGVFEPMWNVRNQLVAPPVLASVQPGHPVWTRLELGKAQGNIRMPRDSGLGCLRIADRGRRRGWTTPPSGTNFRLARFLPVTRQDRILHGWSASRSRVAWKFGRKTGRRKLALKTKSQARESRED